MSASLFFPSHSGASSLQCISPRPGSECGAPAPCSVGNTDCLVRPFTTLGVSLFMRRCPFLSSHLDVTLLSFAVESSSSSFQIFFRGKWPIRSCKFGVFTGGGEFRIFLLHLFSCYVKRTLWIPFVLNSLIFSAIDSGRSFSLVTGFSLLGQVSDCFHPCGFLTSWK